MKRRGRLAGKLAALMTLSLFACVTINIYFPAEKVESAAGEIVQDIRGEKKTEEAPDAKGDQSINSRGGPHRILLAVSSGICWAQDQATTVSNPTIRRLKAQMKERFQQLKPYYQKGALAEKDDGYIDIADTGGLNLKEKRDLRALVEAENSDRKTLYREVAKALDIDSDQIDRVAEIFAKEWRKSVP
jgi:uncharacterized protein YdbL (DUF1318 family)